MTTDVSALASSLFGLNFVFPKGTRVESMSKLDMGLSVVVPRRKSMLNCISALPASASRVARSSYIFIRSLLSGIPRSVGLRLGTACCLHFLVGSAFRDSCSCPNSLNVAVIAGKRLSARMDTVASGRPVIVAGLGVCVVTAVKHWMCSGKVGNSKFKVYDEKKHVGPAYGYENR